MQRYRVNYRLLAGLLVGGLVTAGALHTLWSWQINRNASRYLVKADEAMDAGDPRQAFHDLHQYTRLRKKDMDARVRLANLALDVSELDDATREEHGLAYGIVEETVRQVPEDIDLRRELVDMLMRFGRSHDAIGQIDTLLASKPKDAELKSLRLQGLLAARDYKKAVRYAYKLIGYDASADTFDPTKATTADQPKAYYMLANVLLARDKKPELAERVIDQMVEMNPESVEANLQRTRFYTRLVKMNRDLVMADRAIVKTYGGVEQMVAAEPESEDAKQERDKLMALLEEDRFKQWSERKEKARASLDRALALDATDADVLYQASQFAIDEDDLDTARKMLSEGIERYPDKLAFYDRLARVEAFTDHAEKSLEILDRGIKQFPSVASYTLRQQKIDILFSRHDQAGIERELQAITDLKVPSLEPIVRLERARIKVDQKKWREAAIALKRIVPALYQFPTRQRFAGTLLGGCYEQLGQLDLARDAYNGVLASNPTQERALRGKQRVLAKLQPSESPATSKLDQRIAQEIAKPQDEQDWDLVEKEIEQFAETYNLSEAYGKLVRAQVFVQRKMFPEARELVRESFRLDPDDPGIQRAAIRLLKLEPGTGPMQALKLLDRAVEKFGDSVEMRILRADLFMAIGDENVTEQILALTDGIETWPASDQAKLWSAVGLHMQRLGMLEEALRCWTMATELVPSNLPIRMRVFDLALRQRDDKAMREAQKSILEIVKDTRDSNYVLTEIKRQITAYGRKEMTREELEKVRGMLKDALKERPDWHELVVLDGQLAYLLNQDAEYALKQFDQALELGPPNLPAVRLQVKLLVDRGRYEEAHKIMELVPAAVRGPLLGRLEADILLHAGDREAALATAEKLAASQESQLGTQVWFANLARQAGENEKAEKALLKVVAIDPGNPQYWEQLVSLYVGMKQAEKVTQVLREAQLQLDDEYLSLLTAKYDELQGRWREAEDIYLSAYANRLDDISIARRMAGFYLTWSKANPANRGKAAPLLNNILRAVYEGKLDPADSNAIWAREQTARLLAASGDYQKSQKALRLLTKTGERENSISAGNPLLKAQILATRKDPASILQAIDQLKKIKASQGLDLQNSLELIQLQNRAGLWEEVKSQMVDVIRQYGNDPVVWNTDVSLLIEHDEFGLAEQRLSRLESMVSKQDPSAVMLRARLAAARGDKTGVHQQLLKLIPANLKLADEKQLQGIRKVAQAAAEMGDQQLAEQLLGVYVKRHPEQVMLLIQQLALHGDSDKAIEMMKQIYNKQPDAVIQLGLHMLQQRRTEVSEQAVEGVSRLVAAAVREDPDSVRRRLVEAQLLEFQGQYEESIQAYQKVLAYHDAPGLVRAMAMNNVSFLWALLEQRLDEAVSSIDQAEDILGPIADLLDTRGVIEIARQQYDAATRHLQRSLQVDPSAAKYFHLAQAYMGAGKSSEAVGAWSQAMEMGLSADSLSRLEQERYQELAKKIESLRSTSAKL